jgi:hypothetical protein
METRKRVLINGEAHYDKGTNWYGKNGQELLRRRPRTVITLQEEIHPLSGEWETIAEARGEE